MVWCSVQLITLGYQFNSPTAHVMANFPKNRRKATIRSFTAVLHGEPIEQSWYQTKSCCSHMRNSSLPLLVLTPRCSWWAASLPYTQQCRSHIHIWQSACVYGKRKLFRTEPFSLSQGYAWMFGNVHLLPLLQLALPKAYYYDTCEPHSQTPLITLYSGPENMQ